MAVYDILNQFYIYINIIIVHHQKKTNYNRIYLFVCRYYTTETIYIYIYIYIIIEKLKIDNNNNEREKIKKKEKQKEKKEKKK